MTGIETSFPIQKGSFKGFVEFIVKFNRPILIVLCPLVRLPGAIPGVAQRSMAFTLASNVK
jgi:hypothetical protein